MDVGSRPRRGTIRGLLHDIILEENTNDPNQEMKLKGDFMFKLEIHFGW